MDLQLLITIIVIAIVGIIIIKLLKSIIKITFTMMFAAFLVFLVLMSIIYSDARQLQNSLEEGDKILLYAEDENVLEGVELS